MFTDILQKLIFLIVGLLFVVSAGLICFRLKNVKRTECTQIFKKAEYFNAWIILVCFVTTMIYGIFNHIELKKSVHAIVSLNYSEASQAQNSNGTRYNMAEIISDEVVDKAIKKGALKNVTVKQLKDCLVVYPCVQGGVGDETEYHISTEFAVEYHASKDTDHLDSENVIKLITAAYKEYYIEKYTDNFKLDPEKPDFSKMEYMEPTYGFPIKLGACGEMCLRVSNGRQLLVKVVGTEKLIDQGALVDKFRAFLMLRLKNYLVSLIRQEKLSVFELDEQLERISGDLHTKLKDDFADYGVSLERFFVTNIVKPEDDRDYKRFKELHFRQYADVTEAKLRQQIGLIDQQTKAQQMVIEAEGIARKRSLEGYTYQDERRFDVAEKIAENESAGQFSNMGIGLGMAAGVGGAVGSSIGGMFAGAMNPAPAVPVENAVCAKCGTVLGANAKFCPECGEKYVPPAASGTIECPGCHKQVAQGKFCPECGMKLEAPVCPQCSCNVAPGAKFCPECGCKLN